MTSETMTEALRELLEKGFGPGLVAAARGQQAIEFAGGKAPRIGLGRKPGQPLGQRLGIAGVGARNPAFDVSPAALATGIVTDRGIVQPVTAAAIKAMLA